MDNILLYLKEIERAAHSDQESLNFKTAAEETINWLINNVENFIDNHKKYFRIDLILNESSDFPILNKIHNLYKNLPEDYEIKNANLSPEETESAFLKLNEIKSILDDIISKVKAEIDKCDLLTKLFDKMIFFYELTGITSKGLIFNKLIGSVAIPKFMYDDFPVEVKIKNKKVNQETGEETVVGETTHVIMPGFSLELEISFVKEREQSALF